MVKLWGAGLIALSPVLLLLSAWRARRREDGILKAFLEALEACMRCIRCQRMALPAFALQMARCGPSPLRPFWQDVCQGLSARDADVERVWRAALLHAALPAEARAILDSFPAALHSYDAAQVLRALEHISAELSEYRRAAAERFQKGFRAQAGLECSAALLVLILLF